MTLRWIRLRLVWLLLIPFLWLARPTLETLLAGAPLALAGLLLRSWAAGCLLKDRQLATAGPYAHSRNPLYLGSLLLGAGMVLAGGQWLFLLLLLAFFLAVYLPAMREEAASLQAAFGGAYRDYARHVPLFLPRIAPYRSPQGGGAFFQFSRWRDNREYEPVLATIAVFALLAVRMRLDPIGIA